MKKLIFLTLFFVPLIAFGQSKVVNIDPSKKQDYFTDVITVPSGDDTTSYHCSDDNLKRWSDGIWSVQFNYRDFDSTAASSAADLYIYSTFSVDSNLLDLIWVDLNLDGANDNPWELTDSSLFIWGLTFPAPCILFKLEADSVSFGKKLYVTGIKTN